MNRELDLTVRSREDLLFSGKVKSLTSYNKKGNFDILPQHEQFISLISGQLKFVTTEGEGREINIDNGVLRVYRNKVDIFIETK